MSDLPEVVMPLVKYNSIIVLLEGICGEIQCLS